MYVNQRAQTHIAMYLRMKFPFNYTVLGSHLTKDAMIMNRQPNELRVVFSTTMVSAQQVLGGLRVNRARENGKKSLLFQ